MADMAKLAYRPIGLAVSLGSAAVAGRVVGLIWKKLSDEDEIPDALDAQYSVGKVLAAALIQAGGVRDRPGPGQPGRREGVRAHHRRLAGQLADPVDPEERLRHLILVDQVPEVRSRSVQPRARLATSARTALRVLFLALTAVLALEVAPETGPASE